MNTTEDCRDSLAVKAAHFVVSASMLEDILASYVGGWWRKMVVIDVQVVEERRVARIGEPTTPVEPKINALFIMLKTP